MGGEPVLRAVIDAFVTKLSSDPMIGFFFASVNLTRLKELEFQHAAEFLGGPYTYKGRPLNKAHAPHRIMGGQFARRLVILRETLHEQGVPEAVVEAWLALIISILADLYSLGWICWFLILTCVRIIFCCWCFL